MRLGIDRIPFAPQAALVRSASAFTFVIALTAGACASETTSLEDVRGSGAPGSAGERASDGGAPVTEAGSPSRDPVPGLHAEYFDAYHDKLAERVEANLDHDWKAEPPAPGIGKDRFSARWTGTLTPVVTGKTTIVIDGDDGTRVWIDGKLVIDDWRAHFVERHTAEVELTPILENNASWVGPGHGSVVRVNNTDYFTYHAWRNAGNGTAAAGGRMVLVDRITWKDGWPQIANGSPSTTPQPYPGEPF